MERSSPGYIERLLSQATGLRRALCNNRMMKKLCAALVFLLTVTILWSRTSQARRPYLSIAPPNDVYLRRGIFHTHSLSGFVNIGSSNKPHCDDLRYAGQLHFQQSIHLSDDFMEIAKILNDHPMVNYSGQKQEWSFEEMVNRTWIKPSGSSVWLPKHNVFLAVTRVSFYTRGIPWWPVISFLRGQIYDEDWLEIKNYTINWQGTETTFPTIFEIPAPYEQGGSFYGPEDPRIIIEEGIDDAEPVVIYNLLSDLKEKCRTMHVWLPFSKFSTMLSINGQQDRPHAEKNWAPFFYDLEPSDQRLPNQYLHFVYNLKPLKILKCHLRQGLCDFVYNQTVSHEQDAKYQIRMSGGTNFFQIPVDSTVGTRAYVGFPRTHCGFCGAGAMYRPELMVLVASNGSHFYIGYLSQEIDFGSAVLTPQARIDPCGDGRILIVNSIARWDRDNRQDIMTLLLSVADSTVQMLRVHGVLAYVNGLIHLNNSQMFGVERGTGAELNEQRSNIEINVFGCSVEGVQKNSIEVAKAVHGKELAILTKDLE